MSEKNILFITPPFTQLNTPYPATPYLTGFFKTLGVQTHQLDLGIEVILELFSAKGLDNLFDNVRSNNIKLANNERRILALANDYIATIDSVIQFLQNSNPTLAYSIVERDFLPEAGRFEQIEDLEWAFGTLGTQDKARHLATLYLEDLSDFIQRTIDPHFGFSRYAEKLGLSATSFSPLQEQLLQAPTYIDQILSSLLLPQIEQHHPALVAISVPFPGNLYGAFRCAQIIKTHDSKIKVSMGGGYPNTELRSIKEPQVFDYFDYITLDDGERPLELLLKQISGDIGLNELKRTFIRENGQVVYKNNSKLPDVPFSKTGTPSYSGLPLAKYLSVIEVTNPMHRLWSDGRWNKLTMAHGCYWKKCSFCDISLSYIQDYEPMTASLICDRIEELIAETGETGFHFVDEAAPPALMKEVASEILRRKLSISWWTNIRFESRFTSDLCVLLKASGCIAVSGGLEVASDRLLVKMQKGVSVAQVAQVADNFTASGIMVHAYLMYGFPTQTDQETVDSLEMVRQLFGLGVVQSGFWHRFSMTAHSPIGLNPKEFDVIKTGPETGDFANNDLFHEDPDGADHSLYSAGLKKALFNFMHGVGFEFPLRDWFEFNIPSSSISENYIEDALDRNPGVNLKDSSQLLWIGNAPKMGRYEKKKKDKVVVKCKLIFHNKTSSFSINLPEEEANWLYSVFGQLMTSGNRKFTYADLRASHQAAKLDDFDLFLRSQAWIDLRKAGMLII